jgi:glycogen operon protein
VFLNGEGIADLDQRGEQVTDNSFLLCFNAHHEDIDVTLPNGDYAEKWSVVVDTATGEVGSGTTVPAKSTLTVVARSLVVLERSEEEE